MRPIVEVMTVNFSLLALDQIVNTAALYNDQGAETVFGVIYPPQVALVGFGRVETRPWVDNENGRLCTAPLVTASLAADHRASDGHTGARFLGALRDRLQHPEEL